MAGSSSTESPVTHKIEVLDPLTGEKLWKPVTIVKEYELYGINVIDVMTETGATITMTAEYVHAED